MDKKFKKQLDKKVSINLYLLIGIITLGVLLAGSIFYNIGTHDGYSSKEREIKSLEYEEVEKDFLNSDYELAKEFFLKFLMFKTMLWFKVILIILAIGWILRGICF